MQKSLLEEFFCTYPLLTYDQGERFKRPNEQGRVVRYIKSGYIKIHHYARSGKEISLYLAGPAQYKDLIFNYSPSFDKYYMTALTEVKLWRVPKQDCVTFLNKNPQAALLLIDRLYTAVSSMSLQTEWLKTSNSRLRIAAFLVGMAKSFSQPEPTGSYLMDFPLTHQTIADHTGLTRETISTHMSKFRSEGIIDYANGYIRITNLAPLVATVEKVF